MTTTITATTLDFLSMTTAGDVVVSPESVSAEGTVDLTVRYTATNNNKGLAVPASGATASEDGKSTYGRIQITLPPTWGPRGTLTIGDQGPVIGGPDGTESAVIYEKRQPEPQATYLSLVPSGGVILRKDGGKANDADGNPVALTVTRATDAGWVILIDVDKMTSRQHVTLTIKNLAVPELLGDRTSRVR